MIDLQSVKIGNLQFRCEQYPHLTISLHKGEIDVNVTLNIEPAMRKYMKGNVYKADHLWVYRIHRRVNRMGLLLPTYKELLLREMVSCREAKRKVLGNEIEQLKLEM